MQEQLVLCCAAVLMTDIYNHIYTQQATAHLQIVARQQQLQAVAEGCLRLLLLPAAACCLHIRHEPCKGRDVTLDCDLCDTHSTQHGHTQKALHQGTVPGGGMVSGWVDLFEDGDCNLLLRRLHRRLSEPNFDESR